MSFFIRNKGNKDKAPTQGRKRNKLPHGAPTQKIQGRPQKKQRQKEDDEELVSESDEEIVSSDVADGSDAESESEQETAQEKRLRLAKEYLAQIEVEERAKRNDDDSSGDDKDDLVGKRLKKDLSELSGKFHKKVAENYLCPQPCDITVLKGHRLPLTCIVISSDDRYIFSGSKDGSIIKYDVKSGKRLHVIKSSTKVNKGEGSGKTGRDQHSSSHVLCLAVSSDSKYLASGGRDKLIHIWNPDTCESVHTFRGHRDAVTGLAFRKASHQLYSGSSDRSIKVWSLDEMAYVETLFGHQDAITGIDSLLRERAITSGGRDSSIRVWKIVEESQLVFHGHSGSIDCVALIDEEHFVSGEDSNSLSLWSVMKKKPICHVKNAHGTCAESWITSVASLCHTDLVASGSKDGAIRFWKTENFFHRLSPLFSVALPGFVNGIKFSHRGDFIVAAVGQEHRLGRWWRLKGPAAKNAAYVIRLPKQQQMGESAAVITATGTNGVVTDDSDLENGS